MIVRVPWALSRQMIDRPTGPQPITIATVRRPSWPRRIACHPTAIGSVSAAMSGGSPFGTTSPSDSSTSRASA